MRLGLGRIGLDTKEAVGGAGGADLPAIRRDVLLEDDYFVLLEDGYKLVITTGFSYYLLLEDNYKLLQEDSSKLIIENE